MVKQVFFSASLPPLIENLTEMYNFFQDTCKLKLQRIGQVLNVDRPVGVTIVDDFIYTGKPEFKQNVEELEQDWTNFICFGTARRVEFL